MPEQSDEAPGHDGDGPPDHANGDSGSSGSQFYTIDETVELESIGERTAYIWDIETDADSTEQYTIRAIARNGSFKLRCYIVPEEEVESYRNGENIWWEFWSSRSSKLSVEPEFGQADQDPYEHAGNYSMIIEAESGTLPENPEISVKFRQAE